MIDKSKPTSHFTEYDTLEQRQQITELVERKYSVSRKSRYHVKVLEVNYFITTGTITIDPDVRYKHRGFEALLTLLEEKYPRRAPSMYG